MNLYEMTGVFVLLQALDYSTSVVFLGLAFYILFKNPDHPLNRACFWLLGSFFIWSVSLIFVHNPESLKYIVKLFYSIGAIGWASFGALALNFAITLSGNKTLERLKPLTIIPIPVFIYLQWSGYLAENYILQSWGWSYIWAHSFWPIAYYLYISAFMAASFYIIFFLWRKGESRIIRGQAFIILFSGIISFILALITDIILPQFRIYLMPNIAPSCILFFAFGVIYAITRYKLAVSEEEIIAQAKISLKYAAAIIDCSDDAIYGKTLDGTITSWNKGAQSIYGYLPDEIIGKNIKVLAPLELHSEIDSLLKKISCDETIKHFDTERLRKNGEKISISVSLSPIKDENGKIIGASSIARDITERKKAEKLIQLQNAILSAILNSSEDTIIFALDCEYRYISFNEKHRQEMKKVYQVDIALGQNMLDSITIPEVRPLAKASYDRALRGESFQEIQQQTNTGGWYEFSWNPIRDNIGKVTGLSVFVKDITERKRMESELLHAHEENFRTIFDNAGDGILLADIESKKFYMGNQSICRMLGYDPEEIKNLGVADIHLEKDFPYVIDQFERQAKGEFLVSHDLPVKRKDGTVLYADVNASKVTLAGKTYLMGFFHDNTERRLAEEKLLQNEARLKSILEGSIDGFVLLDLEGKILDVNEAFIRRLGYSRDELLRMKLLETVVEEPGQFFGHLEKIKMTGCDRFETKDRAKNGQFIDVEVSISYLPIEGGRLIAFSHDITQQKKAEEERRMIDEMKKIDMLKDEFVSTVSHELRTPLSTIKEGINLIFDRVTGELNKGQEDLLVTIKNNVMRLTRLINNLLDISKIESGKLELKNETLDIIAVVKEVVLSFEPLTKGKQLELRMALPQQRIELYGDKDKVVEIFTNLIGNALKFTEKGFIEVYVKELENEVECAVSDTGIGIAPDNMALIFDKFQQFGRTPGSGDKGTGLGLSIVKGLVEAHHGKIRAESEPGKGTKIVFTLPKQKNKEVENG